MWRRASRRRYAPNGEPSLWLAAYAGHSNIVELLISRGARIDDDVTTPDKVTPLWISCQEGKIAVVRLLLDGGASVHTSVRPAAAAPPRHPRS